MPHIINSDSVKLVLNKENHQISVTMAKNKDELSEADQKSFDMIRSLRQVLQKPDISQIQLMAWLRQKTKSGSASRQENREWSRFMSSYIGTNANDKTDC